MAPKRICVSSKPNMPKYTNFPQSLRPAALYGTQTVGLRQWGCALPLQAQGKSAGRGRVSEWVSNRSRSVASNACRNTCQRGSAPYNSSSGDSTFRKATSFEFAGYSAEARTAQGCGAVVGGEADSSMRLLPSTSRRNANRARPHPTPARSASNMTLRPRARQSEGASAVTKNTNIIRGPGYTKSDRERATSVTSARSVSPSSTAAAIGSPPKSCSCARSA